MSDFEIPAPTYRVPRRGADPATRRLVLFAAALGGALLVMVGIWSLSGRRPATIPVIEADPRPLRVKPADPGGLQIGGQDEDIMSANGGASDGEGGTLAPPPETPAPLALTARPSRPATAPAAESPTAPPGAPSVATPAAPSAATPPPSAAAPAAAPATAPANTAAGARGPEVQLAALGSEADARKEWERLAHRVPDLLGGRQPLISRFDRDGKTFWRLRTAGFGDIAQATRFCEALRAKQLGCSIASF